MNMLLTIVVVSRRSVVIVSRENRMNTMISVQKRLGYVERVVSTARPQRCRAR